MGIVDLPRDLQALIYEYVIQLRKPRPVLSDELRQDIETYGLLSDVKVHYQFAFGSDYMDWVENALINELNDNMGLLYGVSDDIRSAYPRSTDQEIVGQFMDQSLPNQVPRLWKVMSATKRKRVLQKSPKWLPLESECE